MTSSPIVKISDTISYLGMDSYPGGKTSDGTFQKNINQILPHIEFIDGYLGHSGIRRIMKPSPISIGIEPNKKTIQDWINVRDSHPDNELWNNFTIYNTRFLDVIDLILKDCKKPFIYLDPPYPRNSRKSMLPIYGEFEMTQEDHIELLKWAINQKVPIAICTYPNELYRKYLSGWRVLKYSAQTRKGIATEHIYMNYPEPKELHDYRFIGTNYRVREKFKRRRNTILGKFNRMTLLEQSRIIEELLSITAQTSDGTTCQLDPLKNAMRAPAAEISDETRLKVIWDYAV